MHVFENYFLMFNKIQLVQMVFGWKTQRHSLVQDSFLPSFLLCWVPHPHPRLVLYMVLTAFRSISLTLIPECSHGRLSFLEATKERVWQLPEVADWGYKQDSGRWHSPHIPSSVLLGIWCDWYSCQGAQTTLRCLRLAGNESPVSQLAFLWTVRLDFYFVEELTVRFKKCMIGSGSVAFSFCLPLISIKSSDFFLDSAECDEF